MNKTTAPRSRTYFQFPLCALAFGSSEEERLNAICPYGVIEAGQILWEKFNGQEREECIQACYVPTDFDHRNPLHWYAAAGCRAIGIRLGSLEVAVARHRALSQFRDEFAMRHGPDPLVRLRTDFLFEARDRKGLTYRELAVLVAIYSIIGKKRHPVPITQRRIVQRALGYKSEAVFRQELCRRTDGAQPLTDWQVRSTIESLRARKFFIRATIGRRYTYYSHRLGKREFDEELISRRNRKFISKELRRLEDEALTAKIRNQRAAIVGEAATHSDSKKPA